MFLSWNMTSTVRTELYTVACNVVYFSQYAPTFQTHVLYLLNGDVDYDATYIKTWCPVSPSDCYNAVILVRTFNT